MHMCKIKIEYTCVIKVLKKADSFASKDRRCHERHTQVNKSSLFLQYKLVNYCYKESH